MLSNHGLYYFLCKSLLLIPKTSCPACRLIIFRIGGVGVGAHLSLGFSGSAEAELLVSSNGSREDAQGNNFVIFIVFHCEHEYPVSNYGLRQVYE